MSKNYELLHNIGINVGAQPSLSTITNRKHPREQGVQLAIPLNETNESDWKRIVNTLRRRWKPSTIVAVAILLTAVLVAFGPKPVYEPSAVIEIDPEASDSGVRGAR